MGKYATSAPKNLTATNDEFAQATLGELVYDSKNRKGYMYVQFDNGAGNVASAANALAYWKTAASFIATSDLTDAPSATGANDANFVAGVFTGVVTDQYYTFIQVDGRVSALKTDAGDDIVFGDLLIADPTTDGTVDSVAAGTASTHLIVGVANAADVDADDTVDCLLKLGYQF